MIGALSRMSTLRKPETKPVPTKAIALTTPPGTQKKKRKLSRRARKPHDGATGEHTAVEDGTDNSQLETNSRRPSADVAAETPPRCRGPQTPTLGFRFSQIAFLRAGKSDLLMDHPLRTLLYEFFVEPVLRALQRRWIASERPHQCWYP